MSLKYTKGDLFTTTDSCIIHGCNAKGVMGSGVAKIVKDRHVAAYLSYVDFCANTTFRDRLGQIDVALSKGLVIVNAITQDSFGPAPTKYVSYDAVYECFTRIRDHAGIPKKISIPKIGAGLGGGDWNIIAAIIAERTHGHKDVTVWVHEDVATYPTTDTPEHIRNAYFWASRLGKNSSLEAVYDYKNPNRMSVEMRVCSDQELEDPEVSWIHCFYASVDEALELVRLGIVKDRLGFVMDHKRAT